MDARYRIRFNKGLKVAFCDIVRICLSYDFVGEEFDEDVVYKTAFEDYLYIGYTMVEVIADECFIDMHPTMTVHQIEEIQQLIASLRTIGCDIQFDSGAYQEIFTVVHYEKLEVGLYRANEKMNEIKSSLNDFMNLQRFRLDLPNFAQTKFQSMCENSLSLASPVLSSLLENYFFNLFIAFLKVSDNRDQVLANRERRILLSEVDKYKFNKAYGVEYLCATQISFLNYDKAHTALKQVAGKDIEKIIEVGTEERKVLAYIEDLRNRSIHRGESAHHLEIIQELYPTVAVITDRIEEGICNKYKIWKVAQ